MKTLPQIFASRGDPWDNPDAPEPLVRTVAAWRITLSTGDTMLTTNGKTMQRLKLAGLAVEQVSWDHRSKPEREGDPDMDRWTEAVRQRKRAPLLSRAKLSKPPCREIDGRLNVAKTMRRVRVNMSRPADRTKYEVSWLDGRYSEWFWSKERAQEKIELLGKYVPNSNPILTVEEVR